MLRKVIQMKKITQLYKKYQEIIHYIIVGGLTTVVSLGSYYFLVLTVLNPENAIELQIANVISWVCAVSFAYITNRRFVFKSKNTKKIKEGTNFFISRIATLLIDMSTMFLLVTVLNSNDKLAKLFVQFVVMFLNYVFSKIFVFRKINK